MKLHNFLSTKEKRRELRKNMTESEKVLWARLKNDALGVRFRRQFSIGHYIADFYCPRKKLVIEIDGDIHINQKEYDTVRDKFMKNFGITVLRFWNNDIQYDLDKTILQIKKALEQI